MRNIITKKQLVMLSCLLAAGCSPMVDNKGYVKKANLAEKITVGQTSKQEVLDNFGSPSSQSSFGPESWYYIYNRKETTAFLKPEITDQDITRIEFDSAGIVTKVENYGIDKAQDVKTVSRITPTEGHTMGFIEQTLGNVGRFNKPGAPGDTVAPGRKPGGPGY